MHLSCDAKTGSWGRGNQNSFYNWRHTLLLHGIAIIWWELLTKDVWRILHFWYVYKSKNRWARNEKSGYPGHLLPSLLWFRPHRINQYVSKVLEQDEKTIDDFLKSPSLSIVGDRQAVLYFLSCFRFQYWLTSIQQATCQGVAGEVFGHHNSEEFGKERRGWYAAWGIHDQTKAISKISEKPREVKAFVYEKLM